MNTTKYGLSFNGLTVYSYISSIELIKIMTYAPQELNVETLSGDADDAVSLFTSCNLGGFPAVKQDIEIRSTPFDSESIPKRCECMILD